MVGSPRAGDACDANEVDVNVQKGHCFEIISLNK